jgi:hypothetical protein
MDLVWLPILTLCIGLYFFGLGSYRLFIAGRALFGAANRTLALLAEIYQFDKSTPDPKQPVTSADLAEFVLQRKRLQHRRRRERAARQRRLVKRIQEIELDKRWA